jgi:hypothetical protein
MMLRFPAVNCAGPWEKAAQAFEGINIGATFGRDNPCNY